jgi:hypothetical protein
VSTATVSTRFRSTRSFEGFVKNTGLTDGYSPDRMAALGRDAATNRRRKPALVKSLPGFSSTKEWAWTRACFFSVVVRPRLGRISALPPIQAGVSFGVPRLRGKP